MPTAYMKAGCPRALCTSHWRCHNCSCGTRAIEKLTWCHTRTGAIQTKGPRNTSWVSVASILLLMESTPVSGWLSPVDAVLQMATVTHCGWALLHNILWTEKARFTCEGVFRINSSHLWTQDNLRAIHECEYEFHFNSSVWVGIVWNIVMGPLLLLIGLTAE
jgi:hypothetical protein